MRIIAKRTLREFWERFPDAEQPLKAWFAEAQQAVWPHHQVLKSQYANASIVADDKVVFNIKGNTYRLVVGIDYGWQTIYIKFIGTHPEYDKLNIKAL